MEVILIDIVIRNTGEQPIYEQIYKQIKNQIVSGVLQPGEALPSIRNLAKDLRISVITTKRAYDELEKDGFLCSVAGKGCFVSEQNTELIREAHLKEIEQHMEQIQSLAAACGLGEEEVLDLFRLLWRDQDTEKGDAL